MAAVGFPVQLRLDAEWTLPTSHVPLEVVSSSPFVLTFEEPKLPRGVLHTLPLLHTQANKQRNDYNRFDSQP